MNAKLKIIARAISIRMDRGEYLYAILDSYPALTESERRELIEYFS